MILISDRLIEGSGLLVSRMLGLRNPEQFTVDTDALIDQQRPWIKAKFRDASGGLWHELDLPVLVGEIRFLEVGSTVAVTAAAPR